MNTDIDESSNDAYCDGLIRGVNMALNGRFVDPKDLKPYVPPRINTVFTDRDYEITIPLEKEGQIDGYWSIKGN